MKKRIFIIAEAGVNHNGSLKLGKRLIDAAAEAKADVVKFQTFKAEQLVAKDAPKADYQNKTTPHSLSHWEMIKQLELSDAMHRELFQHCRRRKIEFLSTPFDETSMRYLLKTFRLKKIKIPSGEITNGPFLLSAARTGQPVILSTGMSTLKEVENALSVLAFGYLRNHSAKPGLAAFRAAFKSSEGRGLLRQKVTLLHCVTEYPALIEETNLLAMDLMRDVFGIPTGLSDHTPGIAVSIAAAARGAVVLEKHFTLDRNLKGPDHKASLLPEELKNLVTSVRQVESCLGVAVKKPAPSEIKNLPVARKCLVAQRMIRKGESFTSENLAAKRPGTGISPMKYWEVLGSRASKNYQADELLKR